MREGRSVVVTFDPHPKEVVASTRGAVQLLSTLDERIRMMSDLHVDNLLVIPFTFEFSRISARDFYTEYVDRRVGVSEVVVGYDHTFGRDREAGTEELVALGRALDFSVFAVHPMSVDGEPISSSRMRRALPGGDLESGEDAGVSVQDDGDGRHRRPAGPDAGVPDGKPRAVGSGKQIPANGVYLMALRWPAHRRYGIMNIGVRPTVTAGSPRSLKSTFWILIETSMVRK